MSTLAVNTLTPSTGSSVSIPAFVPSSQFSHRNKIINGRMEIAQRGTSFPAIASTTYSLDRWMYTASTTAVATVTQQADVPSNNEFQYSYRYTVTTSDTSIAASDLALISQFIEGYNVRDLIGKTFTLSFWVRSSKTGIHCVKFGNSLADRSYIVEYTVNAANTWEQKSITVSGGLITTGTWNWTNGIGVALTFALAVGTTYQTTANAWQTGNFVATANQVNCLDTVGNIFAITGVQLEAGSVATPFEHRPYGYELSLCQRYFYQFQASTLRTTSYGGTNSVALFSFKLPVSMRITPVITQPGSFNATNSTGTSLSAINTDFVRVFTTVTTTGVFSWENSGTDATASAEL